MWRKAACILFSFILIVLQGCLLCDQIEPLNQVKSSFTDTDSSSTVTQNDEGGGGKESLYSSHDQGVTIDTGQTTKIVNMGIKEDVEHKFKKFVSFFKSNVQDEDSKILQLINLRFSECSSHFKYSTAMLGLIRETKKMMKQEEKRNMVHLKDFIQELKAYKRKRKNKHSDTDKDRLSKVRKIDSDSRTSSPACFTSDSESCKSDKSRVAHKFESKNFDIASPGSDNSGVASSCKLENEGLDVDTLSNVDVESDKSRVANFRKFESNAFDERTSENEKSHVANSRKFDGNIINVASPESGKSNIAHSCKFGSNIIDVASPENDESNVANPRRFDNEGFDVASPKSPFSDDDVSTSIAIPVGFLKDLSPVVFDQTDVRQTSPVLPDRDGSTNDSLPDIVTMESVQDDGRHSELKQNDVGVIRDRHSMHYNSESRQNDIGVIKDRQSMQDNSESRQNDIHINKDWQSMGNNTDVIKDRHSMQNGDRGSESRQNYMDLNKDKASMQNDRESCNRDIEKDKESRQSELDSNKDKAPRQNELDSNKDKASKQNELDSNKEDESDDDSCMIIEDSSCDSSSVDMLQDKSDRVSVLSPQESPKTISSGSPSVENMGDKSNLVPVIDPQKPSKTSSQSPSVQDTRETNSGFNSNPQTSSNTSCQSLVDSNLVSDSNQEPSLKISQFVSGKNVQDSNLLSGTNQVPSTAVSSQLLSVQDKEDSNLVSVVKTSQSQSVKNAKSDLTSVLNLKTCPKNSQSPSSENPHDKSNLMAVLNLQTSPKTDSSFKKTSSSTSIKSVSEDVRRVNDGASGSKKDEEEEDEDGEKTVKKKKKPPSEKHIKKLEKTIEDLRNTIEELRHRELSLDDLDDEMSTYIFEDKLEKKFVAVWNKLCEFKGRSRTTGRPTEKGFRYSGSRYPEINKKIERVINKSREFPDFHDIKTLVQKVNRKSNLGLNNSRVDMVAREVFIDVGNMLQDRRHEDFMCTFRCRMHDNFSFETDPALYDKELQRKLEQNRQHGKNNLEQVINKYADKQFEITEKKAGGDDGEEEEGDKDGGASLQDEDEDEEEEEEDVDDIEDVDQFVENTELLTKSTPSSQNTQTQVETPSSPPASPTSKLLCHREENESSVNPSVVSTNDRTSALPQLSRVTTETENGSSSTLPQLSRVTMETKNGNSESSDSSVDLKGNKSKVSASERGKESMREGEQDREMEIEVKNSAEKIKNELTEDRKLESKMDNCIIDLDELSQDSHTFENKTVSSDLTDSDALDDRDCHSSDNILSPCKNEISDADDKSLSPQVNEISDADDKSLSPQVNEISDGDENSPSLLQENEISDADENSPSLLQENVISESPTSLDNCELEISENCDKDGTTDKLDARIPESTSSISESGLQNKSDIVMEEDLGLQSTNLSANNSVLLTEADGESDLKQSEPSSNNCVILTEVDGEPDNPDSDLTESRISTNNCVILTEVDGEPDKADSGLKESRISTNNCVLSTKVDGKKESQSLPQGKNHSYIDELSDHAITFPKVPKSDLTNKASSDGWSSNNTHKKSNSGCLDEKVSTEDIVVIEDLEIPPLFPARKFKPHPQSIRPHPQTIKSRPQTAKQNSQSIRPHPQAAKPHPHIVRPHPQSSKLLPQSAKSLPQSGKPGYLITHSHSSSSYTNRGSYKIVNNRNVNQLNRNMNNVTSVQRGSVKGFNASVNVKFTTNPSRNPSYQSSATSFVNTNNRPGKDVREKSMGNGLRHLHSSVPSSKDHLQSTPTGETTTYSKVTNKHLSTNIIKHGSNVDSFVIEIDEADRVDSMNSSLEEEEELSVGTTRDMEDKDVIVLSDSD